MMSSPSRVGVVSIWPIVLTFNVQLVCQVVQPKYICFWAKRLPIIPIVVSHHPVDIKLMVSSSQELFLVILKIQIGDRICFRTFYTRNCKVYNSSFDSDGRDMKGFVVNYIADCGSLPVLDEYVAP